MASYKELKKRYAEGPSYQEKFRGQYGGPIEAPAEEKPTIDEKISNAMKNILPKPTTSAKRDAAAYEQAKAEKTTYVKPANFVAPSQQLYDDAEKEYNDYINSEEHKNMKLQNMAIEAENMLPANSASTYAASSQNKNLQIQEDTREKELRAKRDYYKNLVNAENDRYVMESDLAELATWTEEDRSDLDKYVGFRQTGITSGGYAVPAKEAYKNLVAKYGKEKVDQLAYTWQRDKNAKDAKSLAERSAAAVKGNTGAAVGHSAATVPANLLGSVAGAYGVAMDWATRDNRYSTLDPNNIGTMASVYSGAVRGQVAEDISGDEYDEEGNLVKEGGAIRKAASIGYQGLMSAADSVTRAVATGGLSPVLAATGTFSQTVSEASKQGASPTQAIILGIGSAAIEAATEKVPLDNMLKAAKGGIKGAKAIAKEALRQAAIEAGEEEISLFGNLLLEAAVLQEKSSYKQQIAEAIANGATYEEAKEQADKAVWAEALNTAAVSGFAGVLSGGGSAFVGRNAQTPATTEAEAQNVTEATTEPVAQPQTEQATETQTQPDVAQAVAQELTQAQQEEADAKAAQAQTQETIAQGIAEQYGPMMPQAEPKSQMQQDIDNATAAALAEQGIGEQAAQKETDLPNTGVRVNEQQTDGPGIKGTGAAEKGFSPKYALIDQYGAIEEGENPVRADQLPRSITGEDKVSYTARTALEAEATPDEFAELIENETVKGGFSFIPIKNDETVQKATKTISEEGWDTALANWTADVRSGKTSPDITAIGALLYNNAVNSGNYKEAMDILMDYQMSVRNSAQALQAARILKTLTPSDRLYMIRRSVKRMVEDMKLKQDIKLNENLAKQYQEAATQEEADRILDEIAADVAKQIKPTGMEVFTALRYLNMLGNLRTQIRNVAGNIGSKATYVVKNQIAALMEDAISIVNPEYQRSKVHVVDLKTKKAARDDYQNVKNWLLGGGKYSDRSESEDFAQLVQDKRKILAPGLEQYRRATNWAMEKGDQVFARSAYANALAGYLNARGIKTDDLSTVDPDVLNRAREYAVKQAQEQTFRDNNQVSKFVGGILRGKDTPAWAKVIGEGVMPFRKTPANVLVRAEEYSPLGLINATVNTVRAAKGEITGAEVVDSWAKALTGVGLFALGAALHDMGYLTGGPDADEEKEAFESMNGVQNYAFMLPGGTNLTIDFLSPMAIPLFLGAQFDQIRTEKTDMEWSDYEKLLTSLGDPLIQMSMLQSVNDTLEDLRYVDNTMGQFLLNTMMSYLMQGLTNTLLGQIERSTEENRMTTYVDKDSNVPEWIQRQLGKASQKIPGFDYQQMEYRNAFGQTDRNEGGIAYNLLSPSYASKKNETELTAELDRLREATGANVYPQAPGKTVSYTDTKGNLRKDYNLSMEELEIMQKTQGQTAQKILDSMVENAEYKKLTDQQKVYAINAAYEYAKEKGRKAALPEYYSQAAEWISKTKESDTTAFITRGAKMALDDAIGNAITAVSKNWQVSEAAKADIENTYKAFNSLSRNTQNKILDEASKETEKYINARKAGVSTKNYLDVTKNIQKLGDNQKAAQKYEAVAKTAGLSDSAKDALIKAYMPDYDPNAANPVTTELKYDYAREELGLTAEQFAKAYSVSTEDIKKAEMYEKWKGQGYNQSQCDALWLLLESTSKYQKTDVVSWYNSKRK